MAITDVIVSNAGDITNYKDWRRRVAGMTYIGDRYVRGKARRYYSDGNDRYYFRPITEAEMHRYK